jgi:hypothetical protein
MQSRLVNAQRVEAPGVGAGESQAVVHAAVDMAVLLLEMLGLKEHAFSPDYFVMPSHVEELRAFIAGQPVSPSSRLQGFHQLLAARSLTQ